MTQEISYAIQVGQYMGPKKPIQPRHARMIKVYSDKLKHSQHCAESG